MDNYDEQTYFAITDIVGYSALTMKNIAKDFGVSIDDIYEFITSEEIYQIINEKSVGIDEEGFPIINEKIHCDIVDTLVLRIHNMSMARGASEGYLECAWDEELNDMVFWLSDKGQEYYNSKS